MKSLRNKVIMSAIVLAFALIATIGSTYAWFTVSSTVTATGMTLNVQASDSLLIRVYNNADPSSDTSLLNPDSYKSSVGSADILAATSAGYNNMPTWTLAAVTAANGETAGLTNYSTLTPKTLRYLDELDQTTPTRHLTAASVYNDANGYYVDLKFWVLSQLSANDIVLKDLTISSTDPIEEAVRVAVWEETEWNGTTMVAGDYTATTRVFSYDNGGGTPVGNDYGFVFTSAMTGYSATAGLNVVTTPATLTALQASYYNSTVSGDLTDVYVGTTTTISGANVVATLAADYPTLVNVRIYIEGWDAETTNASLAAVFDVEFSFAIQP